MFGLILVAVLAFIVLAAHAYGADSRIDDVARRRRFDA